MANLRVRAEYYQHFDLDFARDVPAEGLGGWQDAEIELPLAHTALAVMHAWDCGTREQYPGWHRVVEYLPRAEAICATLLPGLLEAARAAGMTIFHIVRPGEYYRHLPGHRRAITLTPPRPPQPRIEPDPATQALWQFRREQTHPGPHNEADIRRGFERVDFPPRVRPEGEEGIAEDSDQLFALCRHHRISHLVYTGFAINGCLMFSPGCMVDMVRRGVMCSAIRQAVTAIENRASAREELGKQLALWQVSLMFGFVFDAHHFQAALAGPRSD